MRLSSSLLAKTTTTQSLFFLFRSTASCLGWLKRHDILTVDNSQVHCGGAARVLEDYLWNALSPFDGQPLRIRLLYLPTRSPELNPIELFWHTLVEPLKSLRLHGAWNGRENVFLLAQNVMSSFDHVLVAHTFRHCGYDV
jgi:transposase